MTSMEKDVNEFVSHAKNANDWGAWIPCYCLAYNTTVNTTKFTPFELVFGRQCTLPLNLMERVDLV